MGDREGDDLAARLRESGVRRDAGLSLCIWRVHSDGDRSLLATPVDADYAERRASQLRDRGWHVEVVEQVAPYGHTDDRRLWQAPFPHRLLDDRIAGHAGGLMDREQSAALAMGTLPTDEVLRIARDHGKAGAPDDDVLALLEEVLRLRARTANQFRSNQDLAHLASLLAAVLHRTDPDLCRRALDDAGYSLHDFFGDDRTGELMEDFIDEQYREAVEHDDREPPPHRNE